MSTFDEFYLASYPRLAQQLSAYLGDGAEAEDVAQEAYLRLWQRWDRVSAYDDPVSWVRRVAWNIATSRWRRLAVTRRHRWWTAAPPAPGDEVTPDRVALVAALRDLPEAHRRAVVLHYIGDLPVEEIAQELGVPRGTVLSWLHRSRQRLAELLADEAARLQPEAPGVAAIQVRARRRAWTRLAAVIAATLTGATAAAAVLVPAVHGIPHPAQSMDQVLWTQGSITLPDEAPAGSRCPTGRRQLEPATTVWPSAPPSTGYLAIGKSVGAAQLSIDGSRAVFGDLTGDGLDEAVLPVECDAPQHISSTLGASYLLVVTRRGGTLQALGYLGEDLWNARWQVIAVADGRLVVRYGAAAGYSLGRLGEQAPFQQRAYAWNGTGLVQVAGLTKLVFARDPIDVSHVAEPVSDLCWPRSDEAHASPLRFFGEPDGDAEIDVDDDGTAEVLMKVFCAGNNVQTPSLFLLKQADGHFEAVDVPLRNAGRYEITKAPTVTGHAFTMTVKDVASGRTEQVVMHWDGNRFVR
ncbi:MAG: SigE family RNA polymerase sigma factor [Catenulispora sp.]|nr:SigE family RNA polymerase sigma factor [Catenulispora sp.]